MRPRLWHSCLCAIPQALSAVSFRGTHFLGFSSEYSHRLCTQFCLQITTWADWDLSAASVVVLISPCGSTGSECGLRFGLAQAPTRRDKQVEQPTVNGPTRHPVNTMSPRGSNHLKYVPLQLHSVTESMEAKLKRLRPSPPEDRSTAPAMDARVPDGTQAHCKSAPTLQKPSSFTRPDAPIIRNVRQGSASEAISSFRLEGEPAFVDELIRDRSANSSQAPAASMLSTLHRFHHEVLDTPDAASSDES